MKKICFFQIFMILVLMLFISCCSFSPSKKKDSEVISDFLPLEWNDDYVFGASQYPPRITVWNSRDGSLVRKYNFFTAKNEESFFNNEGRWLRLHTMQIIDRNIWCIAFGNQCNLIRINVETGEVKFINLEKSYEYLEYIPNGNSDNGAILVVPFAQYMQDFEIKLFDLSGELQKSFSITGTDLDILSASGQYKDGCYYFCAATHNAIGPGEPSLNIYRIIKLNFQSGIYEIISLQNSNILDDNFVEKNMSGLFNSQYTTSLAVKCIKNGDENYLIALDVVGFDDSFGDYDAGRFLFETKDLSSGVFSYTGKKLIDSKDYVKIFPRMYFKTLQQYSMIGNDGDDLYTVFFEDSGKDIFYMPNSETIYMNAKGENIWCSKNAYYYSNTNKKWIYEYEGIYRIDLCEKKVILYLENGTNRIVAAMN